MMADETNNNRNSVARKVNLVVPDEFKREERQDKDERK